MRLVTYLLIPKPYQLNRIKLDSLQILLHADFPAFGFTSEAEAVLGRSDIIG